MKTGEDWLYLYFLIEFQSSVDPWMAVRMLTYVGLLYQDLIKGGRVQGRRLPPVLPIVFYTGEERWSAPTDLAELLPEHPPGILGNYLPRLAYFLVDENAYSDEVLASLQNAVAATIRLKRQETAEDIARLGAAMRAWFAGDPELQRILALWIREYLLRDLKPELDVPESYDLGEVTMQFAERIKEQIRQREQSALQQGLQKGKIEGRLEGEALLLQRQLTRRFGPLPEWARQRLQEATSDELETWADRVLDAARLEDVFVR